MRNLHIDQLKARGACVAETRIFERKFGQGDEATRERVNSVALDFDWFTARNLLLTPAQQKVFDIKARLALRVANKHSDPKQILRRRGLAGAFFEAYNSPME